MAGAVSQLAVGVKPEQRQALIKKQVWAGRSVSDMGV